jgi:hypothetical protein
MKSATFLLKHSIAGATVVLGSLGMVALVYFSLLLWAVLTSGGLGGPLAFPGMVLLVFAAAAASVVIILIPVTTVAEALRMKGGVNRLLEIPIATALLIAYVAVGLAAITFFRDWSVAGTIRGGVVFVVIQLLLLGVYWWALQATHAVASFASAAWRRLTRAYWPSSSS